MPRLPVLTTGNARSEAAWHAYIRRVYHTSIGAGDMVDLNEFTWFYDDPTVQSLLRTTPCLQVCVATIDDWLYEGTLWTGHHGPEVLWPYLGFFVARAFPDPAAVPACDRLEVMHAQTDFNGWEVGVSWFFHTRGSGVFLDCANLPTAGRIVAYPNRAAIPWYPDDSQGSPALARWMDERGVAMLVITRANFWMQSQGPDAGNPRTEIIVRQRQLGGGNYAGGVAEVSEPQQSCLTDAEFGFAFTTGVRATVPCACRATSHLNCDCTGTAEGQPCTSVG